VHAHAAESCDISGIAFAISQAFVGGSAANTQRECDSLVLLNSAVRPAGLPVPKTAGHKTMNGGTKSMKLSSTFGEGVSQFSEPAANRSSSALRKALCISQA